MWRPTAPGVTPMAGTEITTKTTIRMSKTTAGTAKKKMRRIGKTRKRRE